MSPDSSRGRGGGPGRIGIIHFKGDFDTVPALRSTVILLLRHGYTVDILYVRDPAFLPPAFESAAVTSVALPRLPRRGLPTSLRRVAEALLWLFWGLGHCHGRSFACIIGVDPVGLIVSGLLAALLRVPLVYFSLELYLSREITSPLIRQAKALERFFNARCIFTIIQDQERARLIADENRLALDKIVLLPNSPLGPAGRAGCNDYLRKKVGLSAERKLILYAGALTEWTYTRELIQAARQWPADWTLILHSRQYGNDLDLDLADFPWVKSSGGPVPSADLEKLIASADVGLVLYRNADTIWQGDNMTYVGLSSGKLAHYLHCGIPVAALAFPGLCELIERYHCGICVREVGELREAIATLLAHSQEYREGALACFSEVFDFERHFGEVLARLTDREAGR